MGIDNTLAQNYDILWKKIDELEEADKPKSIIKEAENIYAKAKKENNFSQMLKAQMCITEKRCDLDPELFMPDEYEKLLNNIEDDKSISADTRAGRLAVLHCMLANAYEEMQDSYVHDFDEETREQFPLKAKEHTSAALEDMQTLSRIDNKEYEPLIKQMEDGRLFEHDLLYVLIDHILNDWRYSYSEEEKIDIYERAIKVYETNGNRNAVALLRLRELEIRHNSHIKAIHINDYNYQKSLEDLHVKTQDIEAGADVDATLVNTYEDEDKRLIFARKAISQWSASKRVNDFKNIEAHIMAPNIHIESPEHVIANKPLPLTITYKNASSVTLTIREYAGAEKSGKLSEKGTAINTRKYTLVIDDINAQRKENNLTIKAQATDNLTLKPGHYVLVAETEGARDVMELSITSLRAVCVPMPDKKNAMVTVLDNETGRPIANATITRIYSYRTTYGQTLKEKYTTDKNGEAIVPFDTNNKRDGMIIIAVRDMASYGTPSEDITKPVYISKPYSYGKYRDTRTMCSVMTDRSIYRPGQTVHVSTVLYSQTEDVVNVKANRGVILRVMNPDYEDIHHVTGVTNELGSASFEFTLPKEGKLGSYQIRIEGDEDDVTDYQSIEVEEYKRPTFDVQFDKEKNSTKFSLGEIAKVTGQAKTYSDIPVQGATVEYTIKWGEHRLYRWWYTEQHELLTNSTTTDDNGDFTINFPTELPEIVECDSIEFTVAVEVTDISGEMQRGEYSFNVKNPNYKKEDKKDEGPKDDFKISSEEISESQDAVVTFKAKEKDALVHYYIVSNDKIEQKGTKVLDGNELKFTIKYNKEWGDGVNVMVFYVRNGHFYTTNKELPYVRPNKKLTLTWNTFRDKLQPGQKEEWVLSVKDHNNHNVSGAELCAVMYDASLDEFCEHEWNFELSFYRNIFSYNAIASYSNSSLNMHLAPKFTTFKSLSRTFDILKEFEHQRWYKVHTIMNHRMLKAGAPMMAKNTVSMDMVIEEAAVGMAEGVAIRSESVNREMADSYGANKAEITSQSTKQFRTNLAELAFFYPHLTTDNKGEAHITFTLPDCLTEWKFLGFVHTKDLDYGHITAKATAKKDFMIQPNMPRFLREGDKAIVAAKVINMTDKPINGTATLRILKADTEEVVYTQNAEFSVQTSQSTPLSFAINTALSAGDYICDVTATDGNSSDGERNRLPILSTKVDVVENIPFYLDGPSTKSVDLTTLFNGNSNTATDKNLSIGYTDNPALPVFNSLKTMQNPKYDNAPCFAAALYSNLVLLDMSTVLKDYLSDFDAQASQKSANEALEKLKKLQLSDGSWSWFEGMVGSPYITLSVAENLHRLETYFAKHNKEVPMSDISKMLKKALKYLDKKELEDYNYRKAHKLPLKPYNDDLRYLYIATNPNKEMLNKYLDELIKDFKNLTIFGRSQGVITLKKYDRDDAAKKFLESVKEYTMFKDGFGRYFATDLAYYSWMDYRIPTQLAAMRGITAYENLSPTENHQYLIDMQLWLLRQKQTQTWDNPINTLDIADFLLTNNKEASLHTPTTPSLVLDGKEVKTDSIYSVNGAQTLQVSKTSPSISWGHVRTTFKEEVRNLNPYSSGELTISRKVIRDGNKVTIRHILHADRDMDFVKVTSQHAASLEPLQVHSGYQWLGGRGCYLEVRDSQVTMFFDKFTRGTTTIDIDYYIARDGDYNSGYANIECTYAPEFGAHTSGDEINIKK